MPYAFDFLHPFLVMRGHFGREFPAKELWFAGPGDQEFAGPGDQELWFAGPRDRDCATLSLGERFLIFPVVRGVKKLQWFVRLCRY